MQVLGGGAGVFNFRNLSRQLFRNIPLFFYNVNQFLNYDVSIYDDEAFPLLKYVWQNISVNRKRNDLLLKILRPLQVKRNSYLLLTSLDFVSVMEN